MAPIRVRRGDDRSAGPVPCTRAAHGRGVAQELRASTSRRIRGPCIPRISVQRRGVRGVIHAAAGVRAADVGCPGTVGNGKRGDKQDPDRSGKRTEAPNGAVDPGEQGAKASEATPRCRRRDARSANECAAVPRVTEPIADLCKNATLVTAAPSYAWVSARQVWEFGTVNFSTGSIHIDAYMLGPRRTAPGGEMPAR